METKNALVTVEARPEPLTIDLARTAVLVIDMQNDFCTPGGGFDRAGYPHRSSPQHNSVNLDRAGSRAEVGRSGCLPQDGASAGFERSRRTKPSSADKARLHVGRKSSRGSRWTRGPGISQGHMEHGGSA